MATRTIYFVRHGHYDSHSEQRDPLGPGLNAIGVEQAKYTAEKFQKLPITGIYSSPLRRAEETADIIGRVFPDVPVHKTQLLEECIPSIPEEYEQYFSEYPDNEITRCQGQVEKAIARHLKSARGTDKHEILVCHGNIIRYFVCQILQAPVDSWIRMDMCNCGITEVMIASTGKASLISHNDVRHLPDHLITSLLSIRLAQTFFLLAKRAVEHNALVDAHRYGKRSLAYFEDAEHEQAEQVRAWLDTLSTLDM
jgi:serine/threonine-protein phosphatase PGAM5